MFFRKYKIQKTQKKSELVPYIIGIVGVIFISVVGIKIVDTLGSIELEFLWINQSEAGKSILGILDNSIPETQSAPEPVNILLLWRGWGNHDAPELTDTIILASIQPDTDAISLLSIPRDLYVTYPGTTRTWKINGLYESFLNRIWKETAIERLKEKITEITGQKIDFYVNVDFNGFTEIIDILWGIEVTVPENFVDYEYPDGNLWYTTFILRKWTWTLDGEVALKYARSRHSTSDFDRSLRQQQILTAIKNKILSLWYIKDNGKIRELFWVIGTYIETDLDAAALVKLGIDFKTGWDKKILSFNLNDTCFTGSPICEKGWFLYVPQRDFFGGQSVVLVEGSDITSLSNYTALESYMDLIFHQQEIFLENAPIAIYNSTRTKFLAGSLSDTLKKYGFNIPSDDAIGNIREKKFEKSILYYNGINWESSTINFLETSLGIPAEPVPVAQFSDESIQIEIILAEDFEEIQYLEVK